MAGDHRGIPRSTAGHGRYSCGDPPRGGTPLLPAPRLSERVGARVLLKIEGLNPTGSFKDRGMTLAISKALEEGAKAVVCASTGNTSASAAAYATRAGLTCAVLIPEGHIALGKLAQALVHGATVLQVRGNFDEALAIVRRLGDHAPVTVVNSINPYRIQGQKTGAFEIVDILGDAPDVHCIPVGNAGNITAYWRGYCEYRQAGRASKLPRMFGFQAAGAAPIVEGHAIENPETIATAIRIGNPASWYGATAAASESGGAIEAVTDEEILGAYRFLASEEGVFCEAASAASVAGLLKTGRPRRPRPSSASSPATASRILTWPSVRFRFPPRSTPPTTPSWRPSSCDREAGATRCRSPGPGEVPSDQGVGLKRRPWGFGGGELGRGRPGYVADRPRCPVSWVHRRRSSNFWSVAGDPPHQAVLHERTFKGASAELAEPVRTCRTLLSSVRCSLIPGLTNPSTRTQTSEVVDGCRATARAVRIRTKRAGRAPSDRRGDGTRHKLPKQEGRHHRPDLAGGRRRCHAVTEPMEPAPPSAAPARPRSRASSARAAASVDAELKPAATPPTNGDSADHSHGNGTAPAPSNGRTDAAATSEESTSAPESNDGSETATVAQADAPGPARRAPSGPGGSGQNRQQNQQTPAFSGRRQSQRSGQPPRAPASWARADGTRRRWWGRRRRGSPGWRPGSAVSRRARARQWSARPA